MTDLRHNPALTGDTSREALRIQFAALRRLTATSFKIDFFIKGTAPFDAEAQRRSVRQAIGADGTQTVLIKSPEDTILRKLAWFRRGGDISERQWHDVLSVLAAIRGRLDEAYLDRWAAELNVVDLLERARRDVADL